MRNLKRLALLMIFASVQAGCATAGRVASPPPNCPQPQPIDPSLMLSPESEKRVRDELLLPPEPVTRRSEGSSPPSE